MKINDTDRLTAKSFVEKLSKKYASCIRECAKVVLVNVGINPLATGAEVAIASNLISDDTRTDILECAREMAVFLNESTAEMSLLSVIMREDAGPTDQEEGDICPLCGGELDFDGDEEVTYENGRFVETHWRCMDCGAHGTQVNDIVFSRHENVTNGSGEDVSPDDFIY